MCVFCREAKTHVVRVLSCASSVRGRTEARLSLWRELRQSSARVTHDTHDTTGTQTQTQTHTALPSAGRETRTRRSPVVGAHAASPCVAKVGAEPPPPLALEKRRAAARSRSDEREFGGQGLA